MAFQYFLSEKEGLLVISIKASFDGSEDSSVEKCVADALSKRPSGVVLLFAEIYDFPSEGFRGFSLLMRGLKSKCNLVRVTGLREKARKKLIGQGLLSGSEVRETLAEAATEIAQQIKVSNG